jgi:plastocyanin/glucose/arabinose dehydrogenase
MILSTYISQLFNRQTVRLSVLSLTAFGLLSAYPSQTESAHPIRMEIQLPVDSSELPAREEDYYRLVSIPVPEGIFLEVGGMTVLPDGRLAVSTRRGEVWLIENPYMVGNPNPVFKQFAHGLHESLGLAYKNGIFYAAQRSELTRLVDTDKDGIADDYQTVYSWPLSGNYHEYSYGPLILPNNDMLLTLNLGWIGYGASLAKWRGWMLKVSPDGKMTPVATGMRSPAGMGMNRAGDIFYSENQGDWVGSGRMTHVESGDFVGNPAGLAWSDQPGSPLTIKPKDIPDTGEPLFDVAKSVPALKPPAVWFPQGLMGISTSDIQEDATGGAFGPFDGQMFVGDQGHSKVMRVFMEKVNGKYQGVVFPFREGFSSGLLRLAWGKDGSLFAGMTSRGWPATGKEPFGIQRLVWTGKMPFEVKAIRAQPDGFELEFTRPVNKITASDVASYQVTGFTYQYHHEYGSPVINKADCRIRGVVVSEDGLKARLVVDGLREGYIHEVKAEGVRSGSSQPLLHDVAYYTLNSIPAGEKLQLVETDHSAHSEHLAMAKTSTNVPGKVKSKSTTSANPSSAKHVTSQPADWSQPDLTITMGTKPGLKFDKAEVEVKVGSKIKWVFSNNDDMLHNCVIVQPGTAVEVGNLAMKLGLDAQKLNYIPHSAKVLYHTALMQPNSSEAIYFTAPDKPGNYTYLCTFPGHVVMQGTLKVVAR